ncbi:MAG TPA: phosphotransferase, partial [Pyrinomonadaceae bacterium]|nr:phosphotransferase [Pyrinomonadaceae bacterium]
MLDVQRLIGHVFPSRRVAGHELLAGGLINTTLKVHFDGHIEPVVLRVYRDGPAACNKEVALHDLIHQQVPVARIIYAHAEENDDLPSFTVLEYVAGITFQQLKRTNDLEAIRQAAASAGETLARIGSFEFPAPGDLLVNQGQLVVGEKFIDGPDPIPRLLDRFLASTILQQRVGADLIERLHDFMWSYAPVLPDLENDRSLVHNDYGNRN